MSDEIVEFKPGVGPFKLNVVALLKKLTLKSKADPVAVVARRFLQIFQDHGVPITQIPRLVPKLTLDKLSSPETLLPSLNGDVLEHTAKLFQVRQTWLEGVGDQIYDTAWCYKAPERFFQELATLEMESVAFPIVALCSSRKLDGKNDGKQPMALLLREKLCDLGDEEIHRYRIFGDGWDWGYWKCRIQLKAMARMVDKVFHNRIPIYQVKSEALKAVESGNRVPRNCLQGPQLDNMSLEDFALSREESVQSKEAEELSQVIEYVKYHELENVAQRTLAENYKKTQKAPTQSHRRKSKSLKKRQWSTKMSTGNKTNLKQVLRDECLPALGGQSKYYSTEAVKAWLEKRKIHCPPATLNRYFHEFTRTGQVFAAGRGWYSTLATPFTLNREPVAGLVQELNKAFPLLDFSCWSTEQISGAMHHLLSRFVMFVHVETDSRESVWQHLQDTGWDVWLNPRGAEAARFAVRERTVVVRSESRKSPSKTPVAPIEKLLVELCFEARDLQIMGLEEFHTMLANLAGTHRIPMAKLLSYAGARKLPLQQLFGENNQLIPPF